MSTETAVIYVITCVINNRVYVGSAKDGKKRFREHLKALMKGKHWNKKFQRSWDKHKAENFKFEIVEECSLDQRWIREQWWINKLCACDPVCGFNFMHSVQELLPSPEMSRMLKAYWKQRWQDPEYRERRTEELKGLVEKPGVREKMQASKVAAWQDPEFRKDRIERFKKAAKQGKAKLSSRAKALWKDPEYRAKQLIERKKRFKDPAFRAKLSVAATNRPGRATWYIDRTRNEIV